MLKLGWLTAIIFCLLFLSERYHLSLDSHFFEEKSFKGYTLTIGDYRNLSKAIQSMERERQVFSNDFKIYKTNHGLYTIYWEKEDCLVALIKVDKKRRINSEVSMCAY